MGKTRLSEAFQSAAANRQSWFVPLADVEEVPDFIAERLGVQPERLVSMLQNLVDPLIVLDNAESNIDAVRDFVQAVSPALPHLRILVTSREPLQLADEAVLRLGPLDVVASAELVRTRAERFGVTIEDDNVTAALLAELGGIPLALKLAASRLLTHDTAGLLKLTRENREALNSATQELPERHRELEKVLQASWEDLTEPLRQGAARLSAFVDLFDATAASALVELNVLEALVIRSWLERVPTPNGVRFRFSGLLRSFCRERLKADPDVFQTTIQAIARHFIDRDRVGAESRCAPEWMENLFFVAPQLQQLSDRVEATLAVEYPARMRFAYRRWDKLLDEVLSLPEISGHKDWQASLVDGRSLAAIATARLEDAHRYCETAWELVQETDDRSLRASILISRGMIASERGDVENGVQWVGEAIELAGDDFPNITIRALLKLAGPRFVTGDIQGAVDAVNRAAYLAEQLNDTYELGRAQAVRGAIIMGTGDFSGARVAMESAIALHERVNDTESSILSVTNLGNLCLIMGQLDDAQRHFERALELSQETGNAVSEATALEGLAAIYFERGDVATSMLDEAQRLAQPFEAYYEQIEILMSQATHFLRARAFGPARSALSAASHVARSMQIPSWSACVAALSALACALEGDAGGAQAHLVAAAAFEEIDWSWHEAAVAHLVDGAPFDAARAGVAARHLDEEPWRRPPAWIRHNPIRICVQLLQPAVQTSKRLQISADGRTLVMPDGAQHDFSRRGPLRLIVLALARATDTVLTVDDVVDAGWPGEKILPDAARLRVYTTIKRLRNMGFADLIETTDEGYRFTESLAVEIQD
ncbi:MAG: tetratricopeptide repeat protein [bacterium]